MSFRLPKSFHFRLYKFAIGVMRQRDPDIVIGAKDDKNTQDYLLRWYIIPRNRFFNIYLHRFNRSDDDRSLHDHPWWSLSLILRGGYIEHTLKGLKCFHPGAIKFMVGSKNHRVELFKIDGRTVTATTLFITGPKYREWGFYCGGNWKHWTNFEKDNGC